MGCGSSIEPQHPAPLAQQGQQHHQIHPPQPQAQPLAQHPQHHQPQAMASHDQQLHSEWEQPSERTEPQNTAQRIPIQQHTNQHYGQPEANNNQQCGQPHNGYYQQTSHSAQPAHAPVQQPPPHGAFPSGQHQQQLAQQDQHQHQHQHQHQNQHQHQPGPKFCAGCGTAFDEPDISFCPNCGRSTQRTSSEQSRPAVVSQTATNYSAQQQLQQQEQRPQPQLQPQPQQQYAPALHTQAPPQHMQQPHTPFSPHPPPPPPQQQAQSGTHQGMTAVVGGAAGLAVGAAGAGLGAGGGAGGGKVTASMGEVQRLSSLGQERFAKFAGMAKNWAQENLVPAIKDEAATQIAAAAVETAINSVRNSMEAMSGALESAGGLEGMMEGVGGSEGMMEIMAQM